MIDITIVNISVSNPPTIPVGPLYIAAALKKKGYRVDFRDYAVPSYADLSPSIAVSSLEDSASVIGLSCMSDTLPFAIVALKMLKERHPSKVLMLGGPGPTGVAGEVLGAFPFIDIVVIGEGETTVVEVMDCLAGGKKSDLKLVNGISYRDGGEAYVTAPRERIKNLDDLAFPLYESIPMERYPLVNIVFSRGCPYKCTFCDVAPMWGRKNYRRSVDSVIDEIELLRNTYGKTDFEFTDETFVLSRDSISDFCERLRKQDIDITWACTGRINLISEDLLAEMKAAGCKALFYGIESGSDTVLNLVKKDFSVREALDVIHMTVGHMGAVASFIWGFPFETMEDLLKTLLVMVYMSQIGVDTRLNRLAPFALTPLYQEFGDRLECFEEEGHVSPVDPFQSRSLGAEVRDVIRAFPRAFPEFYWFPADGLLEKNRLVKSLDRHWRVADWPDMCEIERSLNVRPVSNMDELR